MSTITVTNLQGHTSGADANKVKLASTQTLDVNGTWMLLVQLSQVISNICKPHWCITRSLDGSALTGAGSMVKLAHTTVAAGDHAIFHLTLRVCFHLLTICIMLHLL